MSEPLYSFLLQTNDGDHVPVFAYWSEAGLHRVIPINGTAIEKAQQFDKDEGLLMDVQWNGEKVGTVCAQPDEDEVDEILAKWRGER